MICWVGERGQTIFCPPGPVPLRKASSKSCSLRTSRGGNFASEIAHPEVKSRDKVQTYSLLAIAFDGRVFGRNMSDNHGHLETIGNPSQCISHEAIVSY